LRCLHLVLKYVGFSGTDATTVAETGAPVLFLALIRKPEGTETLSSGRSIPFIPAKIVDAERSVSEAAYSRSRSASVKVR
jgi:hypothetical protein